MDDLSADKAMSLDREEKQLLLPEQGPTPLSLSRVTSSFPRWKVVLAIALAVYYILPHAIFPMRVHLVYEDVLGYLVFSSHLVQQTHQVHPERTMLETPSAESARNASHSYTATTHVAGTEGDRLSALRVKDQWEALLGLESSGEGNVLEAGTRKSREALMGKQKRWSDLWRDDRDDTPWFMQEPTVWIDTYYPMLNYPVSHSLTLTPPSASEPSFTAKLIEDDVPLDPTSASGRLAVPTFHGLSFNGTASGPLVYASKGRRADFELLKKEGVHLDGTIALVQYGGNFRGLKVKEAAEAGCVGVLIYSDPIDDGDITAEKGYEVYPDGPARQPSSVQRGSVQYLSIYPGDPLTPLEPAYKKTTHRLPRDDPTLNVPTIPSFPISYEDALPLLKSLNGKGKKWSEIGLSSKPSGWKEGGLSYLGVDYFSGPGDERVDMSNIMDDKITPIWNTMALIPGHLSDEIVVLGNHNDAWTFGAGDPNSGTASVHEIVKTLGFLLAKGYKPLRTILLASWDAEEYGLIGSTEFGEDFEHWLKKNVVAYLNVDVSVSGSGFAIGASPSLADLFRNVAALVQDPDQPERTLFDKMLAQDAGKSTAGKELHVPQIGALGSGSDFTVFLQYLGIASANIGFSRQSTDPVYHYHSIYDSAYWMDNFGDKTFKRHVAVAQTLGLATLRLADSIILPINVTAYAYELTTYINQIRSSAATFKVDLTPLDTAAQKVQHAALLLSSSASETQKALDHLNLRPYHPPDPNCPKFIGLLKAARSINHRLKGFEGGFISDEGLPGRTWYRSRVVAPGRLAGYGATSLPGLTEALELDKDKEEATREVKRLVEMFERIAKTLGEGGK